ncbi:MAG: M20 family metallopeptidase [Deltaproteobacteria bacterium]|nr:M20 family metallopeptidase [Deltaproteobacteria bacterium]
MKTDRFLKKKGLIDLTRRLIQIPSENPPGNEKKVALFLKSLLSKMGFRVNIHLSPKGRFNVVAEKRWGKGGRNLIFNGHIDVVPSGDPAQWKYPPYGGKLSNGRIYGRGASDMKGGISSFIHAVSMIDRSKFLLHCGSLILNLVSDEESHGHQGMGFLAKKGKIRGDAVIVGEPTNLDLVIAQKGAFWFRVSTFGRSAHGSKPSQGINAIEKMMKLIDCLNSIPFLKEHPLLGKPTINIGKIQGGIKINIVPDRCEIEVDRRLLPNENKEEILREVKEAIQSLQAQDPILKYQIEEIDYAEPSEIHPDEEIVRIGLEAVKEVLGERPKVRGFSGFTDARFYINQFDIPTLIFGPGGTDQSHTTDESVEVDALVQAARINAEMIVRYLLGRQK